MSEREKRYEQALNLGYSAAWDQRLGPGGGVLPTSLR